MNAHNPSEVDEQPQPNPPVAEPVGVAAPTAPESQIKPHPVTPVPPREAVVREVSSWKGVSVHEHRFGGVEFRLGRRELGHLHALFADLPFPRRVRDELVASGRARPHHVLPNSGWVTALMRTAAEAGNVIGLFRQNYERAANILSAQEEKADEQ